MRTVIIYHSDTGHTKAVAEYLARQTGADLVRVRPRFRYNPVSRVIVGIRRAISGTPEPVDPSPIDVAGYDCIVIGSPVWAGHPTPAINGAIAALQGCTGKKGVVFLTCFVASGEAATILRDALQDRDVAVKGSVTVHGSEQDDYVYLDRLVSMIREPQRREIPVE
ncbi:MAG: flavodoxin [Methanoregulaceae archaeon]|jgi:menaquinone-dependent protoporphyrinogen IX oxidase